MDHTFAKPLYMAFGKGKKRGDIGIGVVASRSGAAVSGRPGGVYL